MNTNLVNIPNILVLAALLIITGVAILILLAPQSAGKHRAKILNLVMNWDLQQARRRYLKETGLDEEVAIKHEKECRRFLGLIAINPGINFGMQSKIVDEYWHTLIECTQLYRNFCQGTAGRFIDHDPDGGSSSSYRRTLNAYRIVYKEEPPKDIWPESEEEVKHSDKVRSEQDSSWNGDTASWIPQTFFLNDSGTHDTGSSSHSHSSDGSSHSSSHSCSGSHGCSSSSCSGSSCSGGSCGGH